MKSIVKKGIALIIVITLISFVQIPVSALSDNVSYIYGDSDEDGDITVADVTVIQYVLANTDVKRFNSKAADVDGIGLSVADATYIQMFLANLIDGFPAYTSYLPKKLDLRNYDGKNYVTPVKCQRFGDCWTFALAGAAEISHLYANDLGTPAGTINDQVDFSEKYITAFMFHGITEDDVKKGKVKASQIGEGFDISEAEKENEEASYFIGGPFVLSANLFGSLFGPVDESLIINGEKAFEYSDEPSFEWNIPISSVYRNAENSAYFKNMNLLSNVAYKNEYGHYKFNKNALDDIKTELLAGHGVCIALNSMHSGFNAKTRTAYYSGNGEPDHAVVVTGYDDDFKKENFTRKDAKGNIIEGSTPPYDGALIIKNSWGLTSYDGNTDDGYVYLSYYDHSLVTPVCFEFEKNSDKNKSRTVDQYDLLMTQWYGVNRYDEITKIANAFDAEDDETLFQIEFRTEDENTKVFYEIYKDVNENDPTSGTLLEKGETVHKYKGFHVIDLNNEYMLKKGNRYSIVLTMTKIDEKNEETKYLEVFPYSTPFSDGMKVNSVINKGESFVYTNGKWTDMTEKRQSLTDTAFLQCVKDYKNINNTLPKIELDKNTFKIDNYPIKALLYKTQ